MRMPGLWTAAVVALFLIFIGVLGTANEIRYQGCLSRIDRAAIAAALSKGNAPLLSDTCSRVPFKH